MTELWETYMDAIATGTQGLQGVPGNDATAIDVGLWHSGHDFVQGDRCYHAKTGYGQCVYRCTASHTSSAAGGTGNEPEVGDTWETKWELFSEGGQDGAGTGDVVGPASSVTNDDVGFADVTGKLLKSMGAFATRLATALAALTATAATPDGDVDTVPLKIAAGQRQATVDTLFTRSVTIPVQAASLMPTSTAGAGAVSSVEIPTNKHNYKIMPFGYATKSYANFSFPLPVGYNGGTISAYIFWHSTGTTSNGVRWGVQGSAIGDNDSLDPAWGTAVEVTDTATGTAYRNLKTSVMSAITLQGTPAGGELASIQVYRDPTHGDDNLQEVVNLVAVWLVVGINKQSEV